MFVNIIHSFLNIVYKCFTAYWFDCTFRCSCSDSWIVCFSPGNSADKTSRFPSDRKQSSSAETSPRGTFTSCILWTEFLTHLMSSPTDINAPPPFRWTMLQVSSRWIITFQTSAWWDCGFLTPMEEVQRRSWGQEVHLVMSDPVGNLCEPFGLPKVRRLVLTERRIFVLMAPNDRY